MKLRSVKYERIFLRNTREFEIREEIREDFLSLWHGTQLSKTLPSLPSLVPHPVLKEIFTTLIQVTINMFDLKTIYAAIDTKRKLILPAWTCKLTKSSPSSFKNTFNEKSNELCQRSLQAALSSLVAGKAAMPPFPIKPKMFCWVQSLQLTIHLCIIYQIRQQDDKNPSNHKSDCKIRRKLSHLWNNQKHSWL